MGVCERIFMDAFESVMAMLLRREGYWISPNFKVELTKEEKRAIGRDSSPRWEIDIVAYKGATNELLAVECKSFLDSRGVVFQDGSLQPPSTYKLFSESTLRDVVLLRLEHQLVESGSCYSRPNVHLALATGKIAKATNRDALKTWFDSNGWILFDDYWVQNKLRNLQDSRYENDIAFVAAKLALRSPR
jgi:hypothetical protein